MSWSRSYAGAAPSHGLRAVLLLVSFPAVLGCAPAGAARRAGLALLVPKLDLRWQLQRTRSARGDGPDLGGSARVHSGFAAWLRWQPTVYAAQLPSPYDLSPAAWAAPCELDDVTCFVELAESERELGDLLPRER